MKVDDQRLAFPWLSKGKITQINPAAMNSAPEVYTGADVFRSANMAMMGAIIPKMRLEVAHNALPVPRSCQYIRVY